MISPLYIAVSGINAAFKKQAASAHNVANSNTDGFKSLVASAEEHEHGGVKVSISKNTEPGADYDNGYGKVAEYSNVTYAREAVDQTSNRHLFAANIASLKTYEEMNESLIDILA
jgi:flagellar basal-body rod protein FlgC